MPDRRSRLYSKPFPKLTLALTLSLFAFGILATCFSSIWPSNYIWASNSIWAPAALAQTHTEEPAPEQINTAPNRPFLRLMADNREISVKKEMRRPFMFFRQALNQRWRPGFFFVFVFMMTVAFRYIAGSFLLAAVKECRNNLFLSVAGALLFLVLTLTIAKVSFAVPELTPMGFLTMGLTELAFVFGLCTSLQAICQKIYESIGLEKKSRMQVRLLEISMMAVVCALAAALTMIGDLGPLPRLGNRLLALLAMVGIGGIGRAIYKKQGDL